MSNPRRENATIAYLSRGQGRSWLLELTTYESDGETVYDREYHAYESKRIALAWAAKCADEVIEL